MVVYLLWKMHIRHMSGSRYEQFLLKLTTLLRASTPLIYGLFKVSWVIGAGSLSTLFSLIKWDRFIKYIDPSGHYTFVFFYDLTFLYHLVTWEIHFIFGSNISGIITTVGRIYSKSKFQYH